MRNTIITLMLGMTLIIFFTIVFEVEICKADSITIYVDDDGGYDYTNIQDAINAANSSDTVYVYSGTYSEIIIDKTITLTGAGSSNTIIDGSGDHTIEITASNVVISGFSIENEGTTFACVYLNSVTNCEIFDCIIKNGGNCVYLVGSNSNTIRDNIIEENNVGIYFSNSDSNTIYDNTIGNNNANGAYLTSSSTGNTLYQNVFYDNIVSNAVDYSSNTWSYNSKGNSWDDYNDYDNNADGIGDNPYVIYTNSQDNYPLGVFLNQEPIASIASITPNPATHSQTVTFYGDWSDDGSIIEWEWKSDKDGVFGYGKNTAYSSLSIGTHTISFRIKDNDEVWSAYDYATLIVESQVSQNQIPTATIIKPNPNIKTTYNYGETVEFQGEGQDTDGTINGWSWRSEPAGIISSNEIFTKNNIPIGEYQIFLKVKDNDNEWSLEKYATIEIIEDTSIQNSPPTAEPGGPYSGYTNTTIFFDASGSFDIDSGDSISSYQWDFGDETTGTDVTYDHTYSTANNYVVTLTVTDSHGITNSKTTYANISTNNNNNNNGNDPTDDGDTEGEKDTGIPGFEIFFVLLALIATVLFRKKQK